MIAFICYVDVRGTIKKHHTASSFYSFCKVGCRVKKPLYTAHFIVYNKYEQHQKEYMEHNINSTLSRLKKIRIRITGINRHTESIHTAMDQLRSQLITQQQQQANQYWNRLRENRQNQDQKFRDRDIEEQVTRELESMNSLDSKMDYDHIKSIADSGYCLPTKRAFRRWYKQYDPEAYKQDYIDSYISGRKDRYYHARKRATTAINNWQPTEDVIAKAKRVMGDCYREPAVNLFDYGD